MPRILGVDIPSEKRSVIALMYLYGIGRSSSEKVLGLAGIDPSIRAKNLTEDELSRLATIIENNYPVEGSLRRQVQQNIARLKEIGSYRGMRHRRNLPVHGQRTKTNARTRKGPKKVVANKKIAT